ncbi:MAG TPA: VOC family protein [Candidatus Dormibacteraeota bacterium]|nr:VOC family protein [Candidatus Dormibacteraeota bacterium]
MGNPVVHFEVTGKDGNALQTFYQQLFAWEIDSSNTNGYGLVNTGGGISGGIGGGDGSDESSWVTFYVEVEDPQATLNQVEKLGGETRMPVTDIPGGPTMALFRDPEGHMIGLLKAEDHTHPHEPS